MFTCRPVEGPFGELSEQALGIKNALCEYNPGNFLYPSSYQSIAQKILDAPVRKDDIWIISYPRAGSTWCQEMVWLIENNLDFEKARSTPQIFRAPLLEGSIVLRDYLEVYQNNTCGDLLEYVNNLPSPRFIKSHLTHDLLPTQIHTIQPKIIYVMRNPKDLCVSYYYYCKLFHDVSVDFETFCEGFLQGLLACGNIFTHYMKFWRRRKEDNILILKYEDAKRDTRETLKKVANFLEKNLSEEDLTNLEEYLSFENMRENKACNLSILIDHKRGKDYYKESGEHFIRKGEVGDWKNHMSPELSKRFDKWIEENTRDTGLYFD